MPRMMTAALLLWGAALPLSAQTIARATPRRADTRAPADTARIGESTTPAADAAPASPRAVRLAAPVKVDGRLDEAVWREAPPFGELTQVQPNEGQPATERTEVRLGYDDDALYVGAMLHDRDAGQIQALLSRRDRDVRGDRFVVYFDGFRDRRTGLYFGVNAAGTQFDGTLLNDDWDNSTWDGVWQAAVHRSDAGWSVEMRIPLSQLRFTRTAEMTWGVNAMRFIGRKGERAYLSPRPLNASGFVSRFRDLTGLDGLAPRRRMELLPYVTQRAEYLNVGAGNPFNDGSRFQPGAGLDAKLGLGANLTLDATVNPDFGQVEVDPAVVNLSDTEVFFEERRPFFVEGQNIFEFGFGGANDFWGFNWSGPQMLYSRRIGRRPQGFAGAAQHSDVPAGTSILGALKLTGKARGWNVGVLSALTQREEARLFDGTGTRRQEVEPLAVYGAARLQREFNGGLQGLGFLATQTERDFRDGRLRTQLNSGATTLGVDGWSFLDAKKTWVLTGWAAASEIRGDRARITALQQNPVHYFQRPDADHVGVDTLATRLRGFAGRLTLNKQRGSVLTNAAFGVLDPGFDVNELGFMTRTDLINAHAGVGYRWTKPSRFARQAWTLVAGFSSWDFQGNNTWRGLFTNGNVQFLNFSRMRWRLGVNPWETLNPRRTRGGPLTLNPSGFDWGVGYDTDDRQLLRGGVEFHGRSFAKASDRGWGVGTFVEWKPSTRATLRLQPAYDRNRVGAQYVAAAADPLATQTFGTRYLFGDLDQHTLSAAIRVNWLFTPTVSLEVYAQPLISSARYRTIRELQSPRSFAFTDYGAPGTSATYDRASGLADPDGAGPAAPIAIGNPDFTFTGLRGNAVLRWEYAPGSTIFLVWTQNRQDVVSDGDFNPGAAVGRLFDRKADNIVMLKATYWWAK